MFRNPGGKIKSYAKVLFWVGVVISIIIGVIEIGSSFVAAAYSYQGSFGTILLGILGGILTVAIGTLISWLAVLTLYAFGTLVENSDELVRLNGGWCFFVTLFCCITGVYSTDMRTMILNICTPVVLIVLGMILPIIRQAQDKKEKGN